MEYFTIKESTPIKKEGYVLVLSCLDPDDDEPRTFIQGINFNNDEEEKVALLYDFYKFIMPLYNKEARQGDREYDHEKICQYLKDHSMLIDLFVRDKEHALTLCAELCEIIYRKPEEIQARELEGDFDSIGYELCCLGWLFDRHERSDIIAEVTNVEVIRYANDQVHILERIKEE